MLRPTVSLVASISSGMPGPNHYTIGPLLPGDLLTEMITQLTGNGNAEDIFPTCQIALYATSSRPGSATEAQNGYPVLPLASIVGHIAETAAATTWNYFSDLRFPLYHVVDEHTRYISLVISSPSFSLYGNYGLSIIREKAAHNDPGS